MGKIHTRCKTFILIFCGSLIIGRCMLLLSVWRRLSWQKGHAHWWCIARACWLSCHAISGRWGFYTRRQKVLCWKLWKSAIQKMATICLWWFPAAPMRSVGGLSRSLAVLIGDTLDWWYCWRKKSQTTTLDVSNPVNNGINMDKLRTSTGFLAGFLVAINSTERWPGDPFTFPNVEATQNSTDKKTRSGKTAGQSFLGSKRRFLEEARGVTGCRWRWSFLMKKTTP